MHLSEQYTAPDAVKRVEHFGNVWKGVLTPDGKLQAKPAGVTPELRYELLPAASCVNYPRDCFTASSGALLDLITGMHSQRRFILR